MGNKSLRLAPVRATLAGLALAALPMASFAYVSVGVAITVAPPALPVYVQPPCPDVGYIWTPGYWAWEDGDYYWVPGTWVLAPSPGLLWTPGYWGWGDRAYIWHAGYWGPHVGFYGGINYGYGYGGVGFEGGYWRHNAFYYNRSVSNLGGIHVTNVYNKTVVNNINVTRVSFNGGNGGLRARPNSRELVAEHDRHVPFTSLQREHEHTAFGNHDLRASVNGGKPRIAATERPGVFSGRGIVAARAAGAPYHGGSDHGGPGRGADAHSDRSGPAHSAADVRGDRGGPGHGPDVHGIPRRGGSEVHTGGLAGREPEGRSDRPPGASGATGPRVNAAGRGAEFHAGGPGTRGAEGHNDRPPGAGGSAMHSNLTGGPGAGAAVRGGSGPSAVTGRNEAPRVPVAHNDRPHGAGADFRGNPGGSPNSGGGHNEAARGPRAHINEGNEIRNAPQGPRLGSSAQLAPRQFSGGGGGGGGGSGSGQPRPQAAPRAQAATPHQQNAPRPEVQRSGGEPHGQARLPPQGRGQENHERR